MTAPAQRYVVRVSARLEHGKSKVSTWGGFDTAIAAEQQAARLRSFGWTAYVVDEQAERAAKHPRRTR